MKYSTSSLLKDIISDGGKHIHIAHWKHCKFFTTIFTFLNLFLQSLQINSKNHKFEIVIISHKLRKGHFVVRVFFILTKTILIEHFLCFSVLLRVIWCENMRLFTKSLYAEKYPHGIENWLLSLMADLLWVSVFPCINHTTIYCQKILSSIGKLLMLYSETPEKEFPCKPLKAFVIIVWLCMVRSFGK